MSNKDDCMSEPLEVDLDNLPPAVIGYEAAVEELFKSTSSDEFRQNGPDAGWLSAITDLILSATFRRDTALLERIHEKLASVDADLANPKDDASRKLPCRVALAVLGAVVVTGYYHIHPPVLRGFQAVNINDNPSI